MNEIKLRKIIREELSKIDEADPQFVSQVTSGFNSASASPEQVMYALELIGGVLVGTAFYKAWQPIKSYVSSLVSKNAKKI